jgi:hypothetical protein
VFLGLICKSCGQSRVAAKKNNPQKRSEWESSSCDAMMVRRARAKQAPLWCVKQTFISHVVALTPQSNFSTAFCDQTGHQGRSEHTPHAVINHQVIGNNPRLARSAKKFISF